METETGRYYAMERSTDLQDWQLVLSFPGDDQLKTFSVPLDDEATFFRFVSIEGGEIQAPVNFDLGAPGIFSGEGQETAQLLADAGVDDANELLNRFRSVHLLNAELERLHEQGVVIDEGQVVHLLREVEMRSNLDTLTGDGALDQEIVDDLIQARASMSELHALLAPLARASTAAVSRMAVAADEPLDRRNREVMMHLNNRLREVGNRTLNVREFRLLRDHVSGLSPLDSATLRRGSQDDPSGRDPNDLLPAQGELRHLSLTPEDISYLPEAARKLSSARMMQMPLPLQVNGTRVDRSSGLPQLVDIAPLPPFTWDDEEHEGYRSFLLNKAGLAILKVYATAQGGRLHIVDSDGTTLIDETIAGDTARAVVLPISAAQVCEEFRVLNDGKTELAILAVDPVRDLDKYAGADGLQVYGLPISVIRWGAQGGAGIFEFTTMDAMGGPLTQELRLTLHDDSSSPASRVALLVSPEGAVTVSELAINNTTSIPLSLQHGRWHLYIVPAGAFTLGEGAHVAELASVALEPLSEAAEVTLDAELASVPLKTRQFVISTLDSASFLHDGEPTGNRAEIKLTLTANIAPYFEQADSFSKIFGDTLAFEAWEIWNANGKTTDGLSNNPQFLAGVAAIRHGNYLPLGWVSDSVSSQMLMSLFTAYMYDELGRNWYTHIDGAESLYDTWASRVVQINAMKFPMGNRYNICDSPSVPFTGEGLPYRQLHPIVPVNVVQFAFPKDRMANEVMPISASYSAVEMDELDEWDLVGSVVKGVVNIGLALYEGNFAAAACGGVGMIDEMNATLEAAEDDPIGTANFRMNRASVAHGFYGLDDDSRNPVICSGQVNGNSDFTLSGPLAWGKLACNAAAIFGYGAYNIDPSNPLDGVASNVGIASGLMKILEGDLTDIDNLEAVFVELAGEDAAKVVAIAGFFDQLRDGYLDEEHMQEDLDLAELSEALSNGTDAWEDFARLIEAVQSMKGIGALGHNVVQSNANYLFNGYSQRKTQGRSTVSVVRSVPLEHIAVQLDSVEVFDFQESFSGHNPAAEVFLNTRVGVVSDQLPASWQSVELQEAYEGAVVAENGSSGYATVGATPFTAYTRRQFDSRIFGRGATSHSWYPRGEDDTLNPTLIDASWTAGAGNNAAAIFIEVGVFEDDGGTTDDDMIGVYSQTFLLEDLMQAGRSTWTRIDSNTWRLSVSDQPVFASRWLQTEVEIGTDYSGLQTSHNAERILHPSALISFHIDIDLGAFSAWFDANDYDVQRLPDSSQLPEDLAPRVVATAGRTDVDQLIAYSAPTALTHRRVEYGEDFHYLDVWTIGLDPASITHRTSIPGEWDSVSLRPFGDEYLHSALARNGRFVLVLSESGLSSYDLDGPISGPTAMVELPGLYPSRLAVDADDETVYVSLREYSSDLRVFRVTETGGLVAVSSYDDVPRTIAGLIPLPRGGVIAHYISHLETDSHAYGLGYWDDYDDVSFAGPSLFENSNGFLHLRNNNGTLEPVAYIDLAGDIDASSMAAAGVRNQSSMFRLYDDNTIISRARNPFSVRLDSAGFMVEMGSTNSKAEDEGFQSRLRGRVIGTNRVSPTIPVVVNRDFGRTYNSNETLLSPFCVYTSNSMVPLETETPLLINCEMFPLPVEDSSLLLTTIAIDPWKPNLNEQLLNRVGDHHDADLAIIDLNAGDTDSEPVLGGSVWVIYSGTQGYFAPISMAWMSNSKLLIGLDATSLDSNSAATIDVGNPDAPVMESWFAPGLFSARGVAAGAVDGSLFVAGATSPASVLRVAGDPAQSPETQTIDLLLSNFDIYDMATHPNGTVVGAGTGSMLFVFYVDAKGSWRHYGRTASEGMVNDLAFNADGSRLAVLRSAMNGMGGYGVALYGTAGLSDAVMPSYQGVWTPSAEIFGHSPTLRRAVFSADGNTLHLAISGYYGAYLRHYVLHLNISDPANISIAGSWMMDNPVSDLTLAPDGRLVVVTLNKVLFADSSNLSHLDAPTSFDITGASRCSVSPDGKLLAIGAGTSMVTFIKL